MSELISVIVPVYNTEKYLRKCVSSILAQTYKNLEIILIDDGSTDNSPAICDELAIIDPRITVLHKTNGGLSSARNAGLNIASGNYIAFVDSDDYVKEDAYKRLYNALIKTCANIACMKFIGTDETYGPENVPDSTYKIKFISNIEYLKSICMYTGSCSFCDKLFRKKIIDGLSFDETKQNEDLLLLSQILINGDGIALLDYYGYYYLRRNTSITHSGFGKAVTDTVYNTVFLENLVKDRIPQIAPYFGRLVLYQSRTFFIMMPYKHIKEKNIDYLFAKNAVKSNRKYLFTSRLAFKDRVFLITFIIAPKTVKRFTELIRSKEYK